MGNSSSKKEADALKGFSEHEIAALRVDFARVAAFRPDPACIDPESLECELKIGQSLCNALFARMQQLGQQPGKAVKTGKEDSMKLATMALAIREICSGDRDTQIEFVLSVLSDRSGNVPLERCREFYAAFIQHSLPDGRQSDSRLRERLVKVSLDAAFARAQSPHSMTQEEAEEWLQHESEARLFFNNLLQAHFLRVPNEHGEIEEVKHKMPLLGRRSKLLTDELLWMMSSFIPDHCLAKPWKRLFCSVRHGQSFARFMTRMVFKGPTVLVIKDSGGHVFGGYAPVSWHKGNRFFGDSHAFLFSAAPSIKVFTSSGYNDHYMWLSTRLVTPHPSSLTHHPSPFTPLTPAPLTPHPSTSTLDPHASTLNPCPLTIPHDLYPHKSRCRALALHREPGCQTCLHAGKHSRACSSDVFLQLEGSRGACARRSSSLHTTRLGFLVRP
jgi:hypothetical protein